MVKIGTRGPIGIYQWDCNRDPTALEQRSHDRISKSKETFVPPKGVSIPILAQMLLKPLPCIPLSSKMSPRQISSTNPPHTDSVRCECGLIFASLTD